MGFSDPLSELRELREAERLSRQLAECRRARRDELFVRASRLGYSRRRIATAAGVDPAVVQRILKKR